MNAIFMMEFRIYVLGLWQNCWQKTCSARWTWMNKTWISTRVVNKRVHRKTFSAPCCSFLLSPFIELSRDPCNCLVKQDFASWYLSLGLRRQWLEGSHMLPGPATFLILALCPRGVIPDPPPSRWHPEYPKDEKRGRKLENPNQCRVNRSPSCMSLEVLLISLSLSVLLPWWSVSQELSFLTEGQPNCLLPKNAHSSSKKTLLM